MNQKPIISIVIPVFNVQDYITETLESVVTQTFGDWEAVVVDDASQDSSLLKAQECARRDPRIKVIRNSRSKGVSGARNTGIDHAQGQWIAFLDADDLFDRRALEYRMSAAQQFPTCQFLSGDFVRFSDGGSPESTPQSLANSTWRSTLHGGGPPIDSPRALKNPIEYFLEQVLTWTGCVTVKAELLKRLGGFNESLRTTEDDHLWLRVAASVDVMVFEPRSLALYRQRANSLTSSGKALHHDAVTAYKLLLEDQLFSAHQAKLRKRIRYFAHQNSFFYRSTRQRRRAVLWGLKATLIDPLSFRSWKNLVASLFLR